MAPRDGDDDPAVYGSGTRQKAQDGSPMKTSNGQEKITNGQKAREIGDAEDEDEDDGSTLLTVQPGFNRLLLVLRDPGVLHFVKYVSAMAPGSRWDVCGEWEVGQVEIDSENGEEQAEEEEQGEEDEGF